MMSVSVDMIAGCTCLDFPSLSVFPLHTVTFPSGKTHDRRKTRNGHISARHACWDRSLGRGTGLELEYIRGEDISHLLLLKPMVFSATVPLCFMYFLQYEDGCMEVCSRIAQTVSWRGFLLVQFSSLRKWMHVSKGSNFNPSG